MCRAALVLCATWIAVPEVVAAPLPDPADPFAAEPPSAPSEPSPEAVRDAERVIEGLRNFVRRAFAPGLPEHDPDHDAPDHLLPPTVPVVDRALRRQFAAARADVAAQRWGEAVERLEGLLRHPESSGFVQRSPGEPNWIGFRAAVLEQILELPPPGRAAYEARFGPDARRALDDALAVHDLAALQALVEQALPTAAGRAALFRLFVRAAERGEAALALDFARRLRTLPESDREFEPALSFRAGLAAARLGRIDEAVDLVKHARTAARGPVVLRGRPVTIPDGDDPARLATWIRTLVAAPSADGAATGPAVLPGAPHERRVAQPFRPVGTPRWYRETTDDPGERARIAEVADRAPEPDAQAVPDPAHVSRAAVGGPFRSPDEDEPLGTYLPQFQPRIVGNLVLMRTVDGFAAHDLRTGRPLWTYPSRSDRGQSGLADHLWNDLAGGSSTADGETLYLAVPDERTGPAEEERVARDVRGAAPAPVVGWAIGPGAGGRARLLRRAPAFGLPVPPTRDPADDDVPAVRNILVALDCRPPREGNRLWHVGGRDGGDEPALAGADFLGPPRPHAGRLFAIARVGESLRLVVLDPADGRLDWSVEIALAPEPSRVAALRRIGPVPSAEGALVVCPTAAGTLVGVDLSTRMVRWAATLEDRFGGILEEGLVDPDGHDLAPDLLAAGSLEAAPAIVDGRVFAMPVESDDLLCLDARDGSVAWEAPRAGWRYVAAIDGKRVVLVGDRHMGALRLADGRPAWRRPVPFPAGVHPSGRGWQAGATYLLPLSNGTIGLVDLATGHLRERIVLRPDLVPGNLYLAGGTLVSQGPTHLAVFDAGDRLAEDVARRLQADPDDASALVDRARLEWDAPRPLEHVLPTLRSAVRTSPDPRTRDLLVKALLEALRTNHGDRAALDRELDALAGP